MNRKSQNDFIISKIPLETLIESLVSVYNSGMDFVDLVINRTPQQDRIGIVIREEYVSQDREVDGEGQHLSDDDLNDLIEN